MRRTNLIFVSPDETFSAALTKMSDNGVTQMPVLEGHSVGRQLQRKPRSCETSCQDRELLDSPKSRDVMDESFPVLEMDTSLLRSNQNSAASRPF